MMKELFQARLAEYAPQHQLDQENLLQETMQHYVLASLSNANLFSHAMFHGGTCLRIFHRLQRFSEDLDFPHIAPVTVQTLTSGFATKLHALLCRVYVKGPDWYDFIWYVSRRINPLFLESMPRWP